VKIDLDVFGALLLDRVHGHVDGANIVAEHNYSRRRWLMKLMEELANPTSLGKCVSHNIVLSLSAGTGHCVLPL
jgi:hypothetical protein